MMNVDTSFTRETGERPSGKRNFTARSTIKVT